jgi:hypothetical protein
MWESSGFVATPENVPLTLVPTSIEKLVVQVAWATSPPPQPVTAIWLQRAREEFDIWAWAWCAGLDPVKEARFHHEQAKAKGCSVFIANMEESYDAHGNQNDPKYHMPTLYLEALAWDGPLAVTTTPKFASNMVEWQKIGAIFMPQSFPGENRIGLTETVQHAADWGWTLDQIRPLVQSYTTQNNWRPDPIELNEEAYNLSVGVVPFTVEQAMDPQGQIWLEIMRPAITRPQRFIDHTPDAPDQGDGMQVIGSQHGIIAAYNRMKKLDPEGCNPAFDPNNPDALPIDQLKAWDKECRTKLILAKDHDEAVAQ